MTKEEKQLLLQDLCARLPYGVKVKLLCRGPEPKFDDWIEVTLNTKDIELFGKSFKNIKPYLRPMESMTEEEKDELKEYLDAEIVDCNGFGYSEGGTLEEYTSSIPYSLCSYIVDWLIAHHFDYRGLIPMNLALPAKEGMYTIK